MLIDPLIIPSMTFKDITGNRYVENALSDYIDLSGEWLLKLPDGLVKTIKVPSAVETVLASKVEEGPFVFTKSFTIPDSWCTGHIVIEAQAISFICEIRLNGITVGEHTGMWSPFQVDISKYARQGQNSLEVQIWKPGNLYPIRESLAGFLPDVATTFSGIWQSIGLRCLPQTYANDIRVLSDSTGNIEIEGELSGLAPTSGVYARLFVAVADGHEVELQTSLRVSNQDGRFQASAKIDQPALWKVGYRADLYSVRLCIYTPENASPAVEIVRRVSFRDITTNREELSLNGAPLHLRGVLDWGWDAQTICPTPTRQQVQDQIKLIRRLGFNMIKLCLFVPDEVTFDVADEEGVALWLELPMWLPKLTPAFKALAIHEYKAILRRVHHHPSVLIVSLGCELNEDTGADFLETLNEIAARWVPHTLRCDNSGSAEAYGGVSTSISDFYDYHFYTDPHYFPAVVDHFTRPYLPAKPWIYGEFCDADTLRDFSLLQPEPWWLTQALPLDREELTWMRDYHARFTKAGVTDGGAALTKIARQQATSIRKFIFEQVRSRHATGGYVITGWIDTPISTSGIVDDQRLLKFEPDEWLSFNQDCVLVIDRERHRRWRGGDQPVHTDPFAWWQDDRPEIHLALSNGLGTILQGTLSYALETDDHTLITENKVAISGVNGGSLTELAVLHVTLPDQNTQDPIELTLNAQAELIFITGETKTVRNRWRFWAIPAKETTLRRIDQAPTNHVLSADLLDMVRSGQNSLLCLDQPDAQLTRVVPFWREAIHVFEDHPLWQAVPQPRYADMRFFSIATDFAIDPSKLRDLVGPYAKLKPIWRRFDARAFEWADYIVEVQLGDGKLLVSTLRFAGGLGYQPDTLATNPTGAWFLRALIDITDHPINR